MKQTDSKPVTTIVVHRKKGRTIFRDEHGTNPDLVFAMAEATRSAAAHQVRTNRDER